MVFDGFSRLIVNGSCLDKCYVICIGCGYNFTKNRILDMQATRRQIIGAVVLSSDQLFYFRNAETK
jgi:hypothetical protein